MTRTRATAIVIKDNKLLMIHRHNHDEEYWVLPGGGVDDRESVEEAVLRELREETSIEAELGEKLTEFVARERTHSLFSCKYLSGEPQIHEESEEFNSKDPNQFYEAVWIDINKLPDLTIHPPGTKEFLIKYSAQETRGH